jgi:hypothetical protein
MSPCDYDLFAKTKELMQGTLYYTREEIICAVGRSLLDINISGRGLPWNKARTWSVRPDIYYYHAVAGLLMWGVLSDERRGLSLQVLLAIASAGLLGSEILRTCYHILLPHIPDFQFLASYDSPGCDGGIRSASTRDRFFLERLSLFIVSF